MLAIEIDFRNVYAEYGWAVEKRHNIFLNWPSPVLDSHWSVVIAVAVKIRRFDWLMGQTEIRVFSPEVVLYGRRTRYREMAALYLSMDMGLFDESDWSRRKDFD